jgi:hypothetical protein
MIDWSTVVMACVAIGAITTIECIALFTHTDGSTLAAVVAAIAALGGGIVGRQTAPSNTPAPST